MKKILALFAISAIGLSLVSASDVFEINYTSYFPDATSSSYSYPTIGTSTDPGVTAGLVYAQRNGTLAYGYSSKTINSVAFRSTMKTGGTCKFNPSSGMPNGRAFAFPISGAGTIEVSYTTSNSTADRVLKIGMMITDVDTTMVLFPSTIISTLNIPTPAPSSSPTANETYTYTGNSSGLCWIFTEPTSTTNMNLYYLKYTQSTSSIQNPEKNTANYKLLPEGIEVEGSKVKVNIFNSLSQLVKSSNENYLSTSDLSKGNYIVTIEADGGASTVQIMK